MADELIHNPEALFGSGLDINFMSYTLFPEPARFGALSRIFAFYVQSNLLWGNSLFGGISPQSSTMARFRATGSPLTASPSRCSSRPIDALPPRHQIFSSLVPVSSPNQHETVVYPSSLPVEEIPSDPTPLTPFFTYHPPCPRLILLPQKDVLVTQC